MRQGGGCGLVMLWVGAAASGCWFGGEGTCRGVLV